MTVKSRTHSDRPVAIVDVGSNSGRVTVLALEHGAHLAVLADARAPLRLVRDVAAKRPLSEKTLARTIETLRGFHAVAQSAGAVRTIAVATSAVREAPNGPELIDRIRREAGVDVEIINGQREGQLGFLGAVYGLPVEHGVVLDVGGGSLQITRFRNRSLVSTLSLPLGALRLSDSFLKSDPPSQKEVRRLREHVANALRTAGVTPLASDESLVGTGGTIRNLAKIHRRANGSPIPRLHGFVVHQSRVRETAALVASCELEARCQIPGLNRDRADSIIGGALVVLSVMDTLAAPDLYVAGHGLREGIALETLLGGTLTPSVEVRAASVSALAARFRTWDSSRAVRRAEIAAHILPGLDHTLPVEAIETLRHAIVLLDIGQSIDYYNRREHSAEIVVSADLLGFSHRGIALLAAVIRGLETGSGLRSFEPLLNPGDLSTVARLGATLLLADVLERFASPGAEIGAIRCERRGNDVVLAAAVLDSWPLKDALERVERAFGVRVTFKPNPAITMAAA